MRKPRVHAVMKKELGINATKRDIDRFLEDMNQADDRLSFQTIRERIEGVKKKMITGKARYKDFKKVEDKTNAQNPFQGLAVWEDHVDAAIARIVEKALLNRKLDHSDINAFRNHINDAVMELERANENYKRQGFIIKADYSYAQGIIKTLELMRAKPEVYANLVYLHAKHGEVTSELVVANKDKLFKKRIKP